MNITGLLGVISILSIQLSFGLKNKRVSDYGIEQITVSAAPNYIGIQVGRKVGQEKTRDQAKHYCQNTLKTNLATILTKSDQNEVVAILRDSRWSNSVDNLWVGWRNNGNNRFQKTWDPCSNCQSSWACSATDEVTDSAMHGIFGNLDANNQCGTIKRNNNNVMGKWDVQPCNNVKRDFICNKPGRKYDPVPFQCSAPTKQPTKRPTNKPTNKPTKRPTNKPTKFPSATPTNPSASPSNDPSNVPTNTPTSIPSDIPTIPPSNNPSINPSGSPTVYPTKFPTINPSLSPSEIPSQNPSLTPTVFADFYESNNYTGVAKRLNANDALQFCSRQFDTGLAVIMDQDDQLELEREVLKPLYENTGGHVVHFGYRDYNGVAEWFVTNKCLAKEPLDETWHTTANSPHTNQCGYINFSEKWSLHWDIGSCSLQRYFVCNNPMGQYKIPC